MAGGTKAPLVSVIMPAYRTTATIAEALDSVLAQTYGNYEIVVVNDGCPDSEALERVLVPYRDRIRYLTQENRGLSGARNAGIRAAEGELIALLDSDDAFLPEYLDRQVSFLARHRDVDVVYPDALIVGEGPNVGRRSMELNPSTGRVTFESVVRQDCNVRVFVTARRSIFERVGLFDEDLRSSEDFDMWLRILKAGGRIAYHREVLVRYRVRPGSLSSDPIWMHESALRVLRKARSSFDLTPGEERAVEEKRVEFESALTFLKAKRAFFQGDWQEARRGFAAFDRQRPDLRTKFVIAALRVAPRALRWSYRLRDRLLVGSSTEF